MKIEKKKENGELTISLFDESFTIPFLQFSANAEYTREC